jgi:hypothetical protein
VEGGNHTHGGLEARQKKALTFGFAFDGFFQQSQCTIGLRSAERLEFLE